MKYASFLTLFLASVASGCGPSAGELREQTLSLLNTEALSIKASTGFIKGAKKGLGQGGGGEK